METSQQKHTVNLLKIDAVCSRITFKKSYIYLKLKEEKFPIPIIQDGSRTAWDEEDINLYIEYMKLNNRNMRWDQFLHTYNGVS